jgi:hypothetical protein
LLRLRLTADRTRSSFSFRPGVRWMLFAKCILHALAGRHVVVHLVLASQVEGDGTVYLLQA